MHDVIFGKKKLIDVAVKAEVLSSKEKKEG